MLLHKLYFKRPLLLLTLLLLTSLSACSPFSKKKPADFLDMTPSSSSYSDLSVPDQSFLSKEIVNVVKEQVPHQSPLIFIPSDSFTQSIATQLTAEGFQVLSQSETTVSELTPYLSFVFEPLNSYQALLRMTISGNYFNRAYGTDNTGLYAVTPGFSLGRQELVSPDF